MANPRWPLASASALWALLPLIARSELGLGAFGYGLLLGCLGLGSIVAAAIMPLVRRRVGLETMITWSTICFAVAGVVVAFVPVMLLVCVLLVLVGMSWIMINATINAVVHTSVANWVRARTLAIHLFCFQGSMAFGAVLWGALATLAGTTVSLAVACASMLLGLAFTSRWPLAMGTEDDTALAPVQAVRLKGEQPASDAGRVYVRVLYRVGAANVDAFMEAMRPLGQARLRNGARRWRIRRPTSVCAPVSEFYFFDDWQQWLQFRARRVMFEQGLETDTQQMLRPDSPVVISLRVAGVRRTFA